MILERLLSAPSIASKRWVYRQYDHMVQTNTSLLPGGDAAVIRVPFDGGGAKYLAMALDCNARYCSLDPREGAKIAVAECARNITMTGGRPLAITDNLNFGNPYVPEVFWQLRNAVEGMAEACRVFETPVTGGNVSLYNQSPVGAVDPTPVVGMVGLIDEEAHITPSSFQSPGDVIILAGGVGSEMGGSSYLAEVHGIKRGLPPRMDLKAERHFLDAVRAAIRSGGVSSAHDISDGGLGVALAESCFGKRLGAEIDFPESGVRPDVVLFNETQGRAILSSPPDRADAVIAELAGQNVKAVKMGQVTESPRIRVRVEGQKASWDTLALQAIYEEVIPKAMAS
jgi:phosphoribosylformylglycinamidine synthase